MVSAIDYHMVFCLEHILNEWIIAEHVACYEIL